MNDAIYKFKRYEDSSLRYTGIETHGAAVVGLFDTTIPTEELFTNNYYLAKNGGLIMLWNDPNFDYNDQLASKYMKYQGQYYDVGTKVMIKGPRGPVKATFCGWKHQSRGCFEAESGSYFDLYDTYTFSACNVY